MEKRIESLALLIHNYYAWLSSEMRKLPKQTCPVLHDIEHFLIKKMKNDQECPKTWSVCGSPTTQPRACDYSFPRM
jgi:hypothetical protein